MNQLLLIPVLLLAACASRPAKTNAVAPAPVGRPVTSDGLRTGEQLKEYRLGRYVDARDPLTMHEGHPIYRVETTSRWDLRPNNAAPLRRGDTIQTTPVSANDAVVAEVNKQRAATRAFTEQTAALNQKLSELGQAVGQSKEIAKQNLELKRDVASLRAQLNSLDGKLREPKPPTPSPSPDDRW